MTQITIRAMARCRAQLLPIGRTATRVLLLAVLLWGSTGLTRVVWAQNARVTLLHVNDVYQITPVDGQGGLAELMTLLRRERAATQHSITTVGGDFLSPSLLLGLTKGTPMPDLFNRIGVDLVGFGNHEFDFGVDTLRQRMGESRFVWLGTNVQEKDGRPFNGALVTTIRHFGDARIGFLGILTEETAKLANLGDAVVLTPAIGAAQKAVAALQAEGVQAIVALTHLSLEEDRALARQVKGLNVILGGHDHDPATLYEGGVLIHKSGYDAHYLGIIDLDIQTSTAKDGKARTRVVPVSWRLVSTGGVTPDTEIAAQVATYTNKLSADLTTVVGRTETDLDSRRAVVRSGESTMGNLITDILRETLAADIALINGGGLRGDALYPAGTSLTRGNFLAEQPFGNVAVLVELTGAQVLAALENGVSQVADGAGRFPQVSGLRFSYNPTHPAGQRVTSVTVSGATLDPAKAYRVATLDYLLSGGDGYASVAAGKVLIDASGAKLVASLVIDAVTARGLVAPTLEGRIQTTTSQP